MDRVAVTPSRVAHRNHGILDNTCTYRTVGILVRVVMMETKRGGANKTHKNPATQVAIRLVVARDHDAHGHAGTDLVIEIKDPLPTLLPMCE